jgi:hypothetical protein
MAPADTVREHLVRVVGSRVLVLYLVSRSFKSRPPGQRERLVCGITSVTDANIETTGWVSDTVWRQALNSVHGASPN